MNFQELAENLGLEVDEYKELIELFIATGSADFHKIQEGMAGHDAEQVMRSAHTIKGAAGNLGLMEVSETARVIEDNARNNQLGDIAPAVQTLEAQFKAIEVFMQG